MRAGTYLASDLSCAAVLSALSERSSQSWAEPGVLSLFEWASMGCPMLPTMVGSFAVCSTLSNLGPDQHLAGGFTTLQGPMGLRRLPEWILSTDPHLELPSGDPLKERVCPAQQLFPRL